MAVFLEFELTTIVVEGLPPIMSGGIKITDKTKDTKIVYGGDHDAIGVVFGAHDIDFTLTTPKDHAALYAAATACREEHKTFTIICQGRPSKNASPKTMHALYDCWFNESSRQIEGMKETVLTIGGSALSGEPVNTEYQ